MSESAVKEELLDVLGMRRSGNTTIGENLKVNMDALMAMTKDYDVITDAPGNTNPFANNVLTKEALPPLEVISAVNTIAKHAIGNTPHPQYKYREDDIIADFLAYIDKTYGQHYKSEDQQIECFDAWLAMGDATPTFRNTAMKYIWRYGKKKYYTESKDDLFKAMHYVLMCMYNDHYRKKAK